MQLNIIPISDNGTMLLIVQVGKEVVVETVKVHEFTQRILNYTSLLAFNEPHVVEDELY